MNTTANTTADHTNQTKIEVNGDFYHLLRVDNNHFKQSISKQELATSPVYCIDQIKTEDVKEGIISWLQQGVDIYQHYFCPRY